MMKIEAAISNYMTSTPFTIDSFDSLAKALALMKEFNIRNLPVKEEYRIVGILSMNDINLMVSQDKEYLGKKTAADAMNSNLYVVRPDASLHEVTSHMAKNKIAAALVMKEGGGLVGIFTEVDALRVLAELSQNLARLCA